MRGFNSHRTDNSIAFNDLSERVDTLDNKLARIIVEKSRPQSIINKNEDDMYVFELDEDMTGASAQATIYPMDESETLETGATVMNTLNKFSHLASGEKGVCFAQRWEGNAWRTAVYWAILPGLGGGQTPATYFQLTADLARSEGSTATADVVVSTDPALLPGNSITVLNRGKSRAFTTARGWALKQNNEWWIVNVNEPAIDSYINFALLASPPAPSGGTHYWNTGIGGSKADQRPLDATTVIAHLALSEYPNSWIPASIIDPSPPGSEPAGSLMNPYNYVAHGSENALLTWNQSTEHFEIVEVLHTNSEGLFIQLDGNQLGDLDTGIGNNGYPSVSPTKIDQALPGYGHANGEVAIPAGGIADPFWKTLDMRSGDSMFTSKSRQPDQTYQVENVQNGVSDHFVAVLLESIIDAKANCQIFSPHDTSIVLQSHQVIFNLNLFDDLVIGDAALVQLSGGRFYAIQAPCPPEPPATVTPDPINYPDP